MVSLVALALAAMPPASKLTRIGWAMRLNLCSAPHTQRHTETIKLTIQVDRTVQCSAHAIKYLPREQRQLGAPQKNY